MKALSSIIRTFIFCFLLTIFIGNIAYGETQKRLNYLGLLVNGTLEEKLDQIFSLIKKYYKKKNYEKVIEIYQEIPPFLPLKSEENLIIARSFLNIGEPQKAIKFADKVISLRLITEICCQARLVKIEALSIMGKKKQALKEINALKKTFCGKEFKDEIKVILYYLNQLKLKALASIPEKTIKNVLGELYKGKVFYLIKQKKPNLALKNAFIWINLYGNYNKGSELLFKIAETYFSMKKFEKANILYELILTEWGTQKEAIFSTFRMYQIAYQKIKIKELIPRKMIDDLIFYIELLKKKYPEEKITQEAHFFELKLFLERKNWYRLKKNALSFFLKYPKSPYTKKAKFYYCQANFNILQDFYKHHAIKKIFNLVKEEESYLEKAKCGNVYFFMGKLNWDYHFWLASTYYFIKSYENKPTQNILPQTLLYLSVLAEEEGNKEIYPLIFSTLEKKYGKIFAQNPWFCYLKALTEVEKGSQKADIWLKKALSLNLPKDYKEKLLRIFRNWALKRKQYQKALNYTLNKEFNPSPEDFILLLACTFSNAPEVFEKTLKVAEKMYPRNFQIKWLAAYFYEKTGKIKIADKFWGEIASGNSYESALAQNYEKFKIFLETAQKLAF